MRSHANEDGVSFARGSFFACALTRFAGNFRLLRVTTDFPPVRQVHSARKAKANDEDHSSPRGGIGNLRSGNPVSPGCGSDDGAIV